MAGNHELGNKIRQIRELKKASLADIASASHLSEKQLEQIENGEIQPALGIISRIAAALGVRVGTFTDNHESRSAVVTRADEVGRVRTSTRISFDPLALTKDDRNMEPSIISINPETGDETELSTHEAVDKVLGKPQVQYTDHSGYIYFYGGTVIKEDNFWDIHNSLMGKIAMGHKYDTDFSKYENQHVGLPYNIPFVFKLKNK